jgi:hypothetical protein
MSIFPRWGRSQAKMAPLTARPTAPAIQVSIPGRDVRKKAAAYRMCPVKNDTRPDRKSFGEVKKMRKTSPAMQNKSPASTRRNSPIPPGVRSGRPQQRARKGQASSVRAPPWTPVSRSTEAPEQYRRRSQDQDIDHPGLHHCKATHIDPHTANPCVGAVSGKPSGKSMTPLTIL